MKILICQISDIHLKEDDSYETEALKVADAINSNLQKTDLCIIVFAGDITWGGEEKEYDAALNMVDIIKSNILSNYQVVFTSVPGNHDCKLIPHDGIRDTLINKIINTNDNYEEFIGKCTSAQSYYFAFDSIFEHSGFIDGLYHLREVNIKNKKVLLYGINTAWMSQLKNKHKTFKFPCEKLPNISTSKYELVITYFHHPFHWFEIENMYAFMEKIEKVSDIVLIGHDHIKRDFAHSGFSYNYYCCNAGAFREHSHSDISRFNLIKLDLEKDSSITTYEYIWNGEIYSKNQSFKDDFVRNINGQSNILRFSNVFFEELNDIGMPLYHKEIGDIQLDDVFIYPNMETIIDDRKTIGIESKDVFETIYNSSYVIISGDEKSGKTSLAKRLSKDLLSKNVYSLLYNFCNIKNINNIDKVIDQVVERQYSSKLIEKYRQLKKEHKCIIIDDFNKIPLCIEEKINLIDLLKEYFGLIIIFIDELFRIEYLIEQKSSLVDNFSNFRICGMGYYLRRELIKKWLLLNGKNSRNDIEEYLNELNSIIGKNLIPTYPFYLLILLNQLQMNKSVKDDNSYGHLYQSLISFRISLTGGTEEIDINDAILSMIGYEMLKSKKNYISEDQYLRICDEYSEVYLKIEPIATMDVFLRYKFMIRKQDKYFFKYDYYQYFYTAKYIAAYYNADQAVKEIVNNMCEGLHHESNAKIMLLVCHLLKEPEIIDKLISIANSIYPNIKEYDFIDHKSVIKNYFIPKEITLVNDDIEQNKQEYLNELDKNGEVDDKFNKQAEDSDQEVFSIVNDLNKTLRIIQILGQVFKNYPGHIKKNIKYQIVNACYSLSLRIIDFFLTVIDENIESVEYSSQYKHALKKKMTPEEIRFENLIYFLLRDFTYFILEHLAYSVGKKTFQEIYDGISQKSDTLSTKLITSILELESLRILKPKDLEVFGKKLFEDENFFTYDLLKEAVGKYLRLNECKFNVRQSLCSSFDIHYRPVLKISEAEKIINA